MQPRNWPSTFRVNSNVPRFSASFSDAAFGSGAFPRLLRYASIVSRAKPQKKNLLLRVEEIFHRLPFGRAANATGDKTRTTHV